MSATTLEQLLEAVHAKVNLYYLGAKPPAGVERFFGDESLEAHGSDVRVTWLPVSDSFLLPQSAGSPNLYEVDESVEAHLRARSREDVRLLRNAVVQALQEVLGRNRYTLSRGDWLAKAGGNLTASGPGYVLQFTLKGHVPRVPAPVPAVLTSTVFSVQLDA